MGFVGSLGPTTEAIAKDIVDSAYVVHRKFGPGLLESVYEECLAYELAKRGHDVIRQLQCPLFYDGHELATPLRIDLMIDDLVMIEVKAVEKMIPIFKSQCLTYLKLTGKRLCIMINFNVDNIGEGITRVVN
jgi:GxxExxY protein